MQQDQIIQAVHPVVAVFLLEVEVLEVEVLEVEHLEVEVLEVEVLEVLEVEVLEVVDQDYHPLVAILETILFLNKEHKKESGYI